MEFKEWLIKEMAHKSLPMEIEVPGDRRETVTIDSIDFEFENYPKHSQEDKDRVTTLLNTNNRFHDYHPFFGKLPESYRFIVWDGDKLEVRTRLPMSGSLSSGGYIELPLKFESDPAHSWWDYATGILGNKIVKKSLKSRSSYE